jgi:hypothetical protein
MTVYDQESVLQAMQDCLSLAWLQAIVIRDQNKQPYQAVWKDQQHISETAGKLIAAIVPNIQKTATLITQIDHSTSEKLQAFNTNTDEIARLEEVIQQNSASSEEMASMSDQLASQVQNLLSNISKYKLPETLLLQHSQQQPPNKHGLYSNITSNDKSVPNTHHAK